jgi:hypothetical protein
MRYHLGLGVGHICTDSQQASRFDRTAAEGSPEHNMDVSGLDSAQNDDQLDCGSDSLDVAHDIPEESGSEHSLDLSDSDSGDSQRSEGDGFHDEEFEGMHEMYGPDYFVD